MYNIKDFIAYTGSKLTGNESVIVWSRATGYFFTTASLVKDGQTICGIEDA